MAAKRAKITKTLIERLQPHETLWDSAVSGFCARRRAGDAVSYGLKYRTKDGAQRWATIGKHGSPWTPDMARIEAQRLLGEVVQGEDPAGAKVSARKAMTVAELCDRYIDDVETGRVLTRRGKRKKDSTLATDKGRVARHIKPLLGKLKVAAVTREHIRKFQADVASGETAVRVKTGLHGLARVTGGRGTATRTMGLVGAIFSHAVELGVRADNPCRGVRRAADEKRTRRLMPAEYAGLGAVLRDTEGESWPIAFAAIKMLTISGWRRGEVTSLRWNEVELTTRTARLSDTKTGESIRPLSNAACDLLKALPRFGALVFPASAPEKKRDGEEKGAQSRRRALDKPMTGLPKVWSRVVKQANLPADVVMHTLRHSYASTAADLGQSELAIAGQLGHRKNSTTSGYVHHADAVLIAAADAVADAISTAMGDIKEPAKVVSLDSRRPA